MASKTLFALVCRWIVGGLIIWGAVIYMREARELNDFMLFLMIAAFWVLPGILALDTLIFVIRILYRHFGTSRG